MAKRRSSQVPEDDGKLIITTGARLDTKVHETPMQDQPVDTPTAMYGDPSGTTTADQRPASPFDREVPASSLSGTFDGWVGEVVGEYGGSTHPTLGVVQGIDVVRVSQAWGTNNTPAAGAIAPAWSAPEPSLLSALPFPARHDQAAYHVAVGEFVAVITGRDGRCWYIADDLPFIATVIKEADGASIKEDNAGGAGLLAVTVRRQAISGDPDDVAFAGATLADLQDADSADIEYADVLVIGPTGQSHGYRTGDKVWVQRRGRYYFVVPGPSSFPALIHNAGPDGEANLASNHYW
ncbi:MAG TPA: hypothetical protein VM243_07590, partial [Phycisphaerae bacterium]|nr:hypothetical protein [Phycisphaerae bacterium]